MKRNMKRNMERYADCSVSSKLPSGNDVYFDNEMLDGHYDKMALFANTSRRKNNANNKISEFKSNLNAGVNKHNTTRKTFDTLVVDIPAYYKKISEQQTQAVTTIKGYKIQSDTAIESTDTAVDAYITKLNTIDVPGKIQSQLKLETNRQLDNVRNTKTNYSNTIDFNTYLTKP